MLYYQIKVGVTPGSVPENDGASAYDLDSAYRKFNKRAAGVEGRLARENGARWALAIVNQSTTTSTVVMVCEVGTDWAQLVRSFYAALEVPVISVQASEVTQVELERALDESDRMGSYRLQDSDRWVRFGFRASRQG
ncbi:hypothetical protein [Lacticaseibacillus kribbianus]|uniref:hypothetical protein n=1 Tax=Lacticaseibacillus kribbianus TaxID=2926292 RepID=UPI001CD45766|nr:hypothetical protein [Lacticaseibacillus kribbianus]